MLASNSTEQVFPKVDNKHTHTCVESARKKERETRDRDFFFQVREKTYTNSYNKKPSKFIHLSNDYSQFTVCIAQCQELRKTSKLDLVCGPKNFVL